jgi:hypothetical protein
MAVTLIQAGTSLQLMDADGALTTLTLPTGITLSDSVPPRFITYGEYVYLVNTPSRPLKIDASGTVRPMTPAAPSIGATLTGPNAGALSGTFKERQTFVVFDAAGKLIGESDFSPTSNALSIAAKKLLVSGIPLSGETIDGRRLYRTSSSTDVFFQWLDLDGNVITTVEDDLSDAGIATFSAPALGTPPKLTLIAEFRDRLFGVGDTDVDSLRYTEVGAPWAWPEDNVFSVPAVGADTIGVTMLANRRDALGIGKLNRFLQFTGTDDTNFRLVTLSEEVGVLSQESVATYKDVVYFLWHDGVYQWSADGFKCLSDEGGVRRWFTSNDYFDREEFIHATGRIDPVRGKYRLYLLTPDLVWNWVEYDLGTRTWFGPHTTSVIIPSSAFTLYSAANRPYLVTGARDGGIYAQQTDRAQDTSLAGQVAGITLDVDTKAFSATGDTPDITQYWGELTVLGKAQDEDHAGTVQITATVGDLGDDPTDPLDYDTSKSRDGGVGRLGIGALCQLNLHHESDGDEPIEIYGLEISDVSAVGRR